MKSLLSIILCLTLLCGILPINALADSIPSQNSDPEFPETHSLGEIGGYLSGNFITSSKLFEERKFTWSKGWGFAAERGNNLSDRLHGLNATVIGDNNIKNGPDRVINRNGTRIWIQDKYCQSAARSVNAAFDEQTGLYRYLDGSGRPMLLEVPSDQYEDALKYMRTKIEDGCIPGVTNPDDAPKLLRKGKLSYKQAVNIAKAGNIDSLKYDAKNGAVVASCALGISFVLDYACCQLNGLDFDTAVKTAGLNAIKSGSVVFATYVISSQLAKTGVSKAFAPAATAIAHSLGDNVCKAVLRQVGMQSASQTAATTAEHMVALISRELIADGVLVIVLTSVDVADLFRGRISKEELLKNLTVTIVTVAAGTAGFYGGAALGTFIAPGAGTAIGEILGAVAAGSLSAWAAESLIAPFYESDAEEMFTIISDEFTVLCGDYLIDENEGDHITDCLQAALSGDTLKKMYASENRSEFARELLEPLFLEEAEQRPELSIPTTEQLRQEMKTTLHGVVFIH